MEKRFEEGIEILPYSLVESAGGSVKGIEDALLQCIKPGPMGQVRGNQLYLLLVPEMFIFFACPKKTNQKKGPP